MILYYFFDKIFVFSGNRQIDNLSQFQNQN